MAAIGSKVDTSTADFERNASWMHGLVEALQTEVERVRQGGGQTAVERHLSRGKLLPRDRVRTLLDPGSPFLELSQLAAHDLYGDDIPSAGIITGVGRVAGRDREAAC